MPDKKFRCLRISHSKDAHNAELKELSVSDLSKGDTIIQVSYSSMNYKDALAVTGKGKILRASPLNPGIDSAGYVISSENPDFKPGDQVVITGCNQGEVYDGGYSEVTQFHSNQIIPLPKGLTLKEAMILGTAGFTAALCIDRMEENGQTPESGPIVVTGASGGVGSFAVSMLAKLGYAVTAISSKKPAHDYLKSLGANTVCSIEDLQLNSSPLAKARFAGVIDNLGGDVLSRLLAHVDLWGNVAAVGLAASQELNTTVMPMILRGVSILGISSNNTPHDRRRRLWKRLASDLKPINLELIHSHTIGLSEANEFAEKVINNQISGRILVDLSLR